MARKVWMKPETYGNFAIKVVKVPLDIGYEVVAYAFRGSVKLFQEVGNTKDEAVKRVKKTLKKKYL